MNLQTASKIAHWKPLAFLLVCALIVFLGTVSTAQGMPNSPTAPDLTVYADALAGGWDNYSWGAAINLANPSPVHGGSASIATTINDTSWGGLYLNTATALNSSDYTAVRFWIHGGTAGGQQINFKIIDGSGGNWDPYVAVVPTANTWTQITVNFSQVSDPATIGGLVWQDATGGSQPAFYVDDIVLVGQSGPTRTPSPTPPPGAGPALSVNAAADVHPISPYIYGMNWADEDLATELRLPVNRWGGNSTSRYNWTVNISNSGNDWYYENVPFDNADDFVERNDQTDTATLLTVPLIGWVANPESPTNHPFDCGFKVSVYGEQVPDPDRSWMPATDWEWDPDCGSGFRDTGSGPEPITGNDPLDTSIAITPAFATSWINHLTTQYGTAANGGVMFYNLDNEPMIWSSTHRDVHPAGVSYDELRDKTYAYAAAIKAADPTAKTLGPVEWGWCSYFYSGADGGCQDGPDRQAHGGADWVVWYLQQMRAYEQAHGVRILDYFDLHGYSYEGVSLEPAGDAALQARRLRSTRALWDPTYYDEGWVGQDLGQSVHLIPRMKQWVDANYPGTKLAITEYNWGGLEHINGALAQADSLGIFGREGLDLATIWGPPTSDQPGAYAFRIYLNYDGANGQFGDTSVRAVSADQGQLAIYAAQRSTDDALTLVIINKTGQALTSQVAISNFQPQAVAEVYRYSAVNLNAIVRQPDQAVTSSGFSATFPANSITLVVIPALDQPDLSASSKSVNVPVADTGETLTYTIHIINQGVSLTSTVYLTDTIPAGLAYVPGSLTATSGALDDSAAPALHWSGVLPATPSVTIRYQVTVTANTPVLITNNALISYAGHPPLTISKTVFVNGYLIYLPLTKR